MTKKERVFIFVVIVINLCLMIGLVGIQWGMINRSKDIVYCLEHNTCPHISHKGNNK